jgi:hypothetical protein
MAKKRKELENAPTENISEGASQETVEISTPVNSGKEDKNVETVQLKVTTSIMSLETMEDVKLVKIEDFQNVTSTQEAESRLGNDSAKLLDVINRGLQAMRKEELRQDSEGWRTLDDKGNPNGPFVGEMVDSDKIGGLILQFAKVNGYSDTKDSGKRKTIKEAASKLVKTLVQTNEEIRKSVAYAPESDVATAPVSEEPTIQ